MTVPAMRAAVVAIRSGLFDDVTNDVLTHAERAVGPAVISSAGEPVSHVSWSQACFGGRAVLVVAGHAGAGASTVALAMAEGLVEARRVQLVDYSEPARSGLAAAPTVELGTDGAGWRCGRRGRLEVLRLARRRPYDGALPGLPEADADATAVIDLGWSTTCALLDSRRSLVGCALVVVTRVTVPAVRQVEHVLAAVGAEAVVAAVGPARWPRQVEGSCGPRLREERSAGRVVPVPFDRRLQTAGLTGDRLPKSVVAAGRALAEVVMPAAPARHPRAAGRTRPAGADR